jgi:hypothetical protein
MRSAEWKFFTPPRASAAEPWKEAKIALLRIPNSALRTPLDSPPETGYLVRPLSGGA